MSVITTSIINNDSKNVNIQSITTDSYNFNQKSQTINAESSAYDPFHTTFDDMIYGAKSINAENFHFEVPGSSKERGNGNVKINNCNMLFEPFHSFDLVRVHLIIPNCKTFYNPSFHVVENKAHNYGIGLRDEQNGITSIKMLGWFNLFVHDINNANITVNSIKVQIGSGNEQSVQYLYGSGVTTDVGSSAGGDKTYVACSVGGVAGKNLERFNTNMSYYAIRFQIMQIVTDVKQ